jgi:hypothetical protein
LFLIARAIKEEQHDRLHSTVAPDAHFLCIGFYRGSPGATNSCFSDCNDADLLPELRKHISEL